MPEEFSWDRVLRERGMLEEPHDESAEPLTPPTPEPQAILILAPSPDEPAITMPVVPDPEPVSEELIQYGPIEFIGPPLPHSPAQEPVHEVACEASVETPNDAEVFLEPLSEVSFDLVDEQVVAESACEMERFGPPEFCGPLPSLEPEPVTSEVAEPVFFGPPEFYGPPEPPLVEQSKVLEVPAIEPDHADDPLILVTAEQDPEYSSQDAGPLSVSEAEPSIAAPLLEVEEPAPVMAELPAPEQKTTPIIRLFSERQELQVLSQLVTPAQMKQAKARQKETKEPLAGILVSQRFTTEKRLLQAYAHQLGVSPWHLESDPPTAEALESLPYELCQTHLLMPVAKRGDLLLVAMANPGDMVAIEAIRSTSHLRVEPVLADATRLASAIESAYHQRESRETKSVDTLVDRAMQDFSADVKAAKKTERAMLTEADTRPVIGLVNQIVSDAIRMQASDIHLEPRYDRMEIRYRLDGQLLRVRQIPHELMPMLVTRIKIMAEVDIVEHRMPQDGRITAQLENGSTVDLRVSVLPNVHGARIVLRILDKSVGLKRLDRLGFDPENLSMFRALVEKPYGLFLVTGPTGSGKTTTLYAALNEVKNDHNNIMTCEDPVEYDLEGINQSQVNERVGLTFAQQLRAILRQDPDIVLVGEIRDQETAQTAIRASLTGHMVLSTLHCNDAPSAIPRLLDMGVDAYLLSTSLIGTMGQRLLRTLCPHCKVEKPVEPEETEILTQHFGVGHVESLWNAVGCERCYGTGFLGRMAVHEVMPITEEVGRLVASRASVEELRETAGFYGYQTMQQDALNRVLAGQTTLSEARRLLFFDTLTRRETARSCHLRAA